MQTNSHFFPRSYVLFSPLASRTAFRASVFNFKSFAKKKICFLTFRAIVSFRSDFFSHLAFVSWVYSISWSFVHHLFSVMASRHSTIQTALPFIIERNTLSESFFFTFFSTENVFTLQHLHTVLFFWCVNHANTYLECVCFSMKRARSVFYTVNFKCFFCFRTGSFNDLFYSFAKYSWAVFLATTSKWFHIHFNWFICTLEIDKWITDILGVKWLAANVEKPSYYSKSGCCTLWLFLRV